MVILGTGGSQAWTVRVLPAPCAGNTRHHHGVVRSDNAGIVLLDNQ